MSKVESLIPLVIQAHAEFCYGTPRQPKFNWLMPELNAEETLEIIRRAMPLINTAFYNNLQKSMEGARSITMQTMLNPNNPHEAWAIAATVDYIDTNRFREHLYITGSKPCQEFLNNGGTMDDLIPLQEALDTLRANRRANRKRRDDDGTPTR
jgi:hypothetical protein